MKVVVRLPEVVSEVTKTEISIDGNIRFGTTYMHDMPKGRELEANFFPEGRSAVRIINRIDGCTAYNYNNEFLLKSEDCHLVIDVWGKEEYKAIISKEDLDWLFMYYEKRGWGFHKIRPNLFKLYKDGGEKIILVSPREDQDV